MSNECALIIFIKNPQKGKVKTRLASSVGDEEALNIYYTLLAHTRKIVLTLKNITLYLYYSEFIDEHDHWENEIFNKNIQISGNLGLKMENAFENILQKHQKVAIIGSDCLELTSSIITEAFYQLDNTDCIIGPADDGGYYLIGMKNKVIPSIFENISWSSEEVLNQTISKLNQLNLHYKLLQTLTDIDELKDWVKKRNYDL